MKEDSSHYFSDDYITARERFIAAARTCGAAMYKLKLEQRASDDSPLSIDIAWFGTSAPKRVVIHSSGLHGVEGFAGSAIQLALMDRKMYVRSDSAILLVHTLNPYGMARLRRVNENNVDLNRNFLACKAKRPLLSEAYRQLSDFLNPASPPVIDFFYPRAAAFVLRYGVKRLMQAIAEGQYVYPKGLFFGGEQLEEGPSLYQSWLAEKLKSPQRVFAIDVHTGLGRSGHESLLLRRSSTSVEKLTSKLESSPSFGVAEKKVGYEVFGGYANSFDVFCNRPKMDVVTQEFGTYPSIQVLRALSKENRSHHSAGGNPTHPEKLRLKEVFAPSSAKWRSEIIAKGVSFAQKVFEYV